MSETSHKPIPDLWPQIARRLSRWGRVLVAVSGGADSVALLHLCLPRKAAQRRRLVIGHVHHGTGAHADEALAFVESLADEVGCDLFVRRVEINDNERKQHGFEAAARDRRYASLEQMADETGGELILTGHTADDLAEGVLLNLMRGAGSRGLAGARELVGRYYRPLLDFRHDELVAFLAQMGVRFVEDPSNRDERFTRNRIRQRLRPLIETEFGEGAWRNLAHSARLLATTDATLYSLTNAILNDLLIARKPRWVYLALTPLHGYLQELRVRVLQTALESVQGGETEDSYVTRETLGRLDRLRLAKPGTRVRLPGDVLATVTDLGVIFDGVAFAEPATWALPGEVMLADGSRLIAASLQPTPISGIKQTDRCVEWVDADAVGARLTVRPQRRGDRMQPLGVDHERKVSRLESGAEQHPGPKWVVENERGIVWSVGRRIAHWARMTEQTRHCWRLTHTPPEDGEESKRDTDVRSF